MTAFLSDVLFYLCPDAKWVTYGDTYADIDWQDETIPKPTEEEVEAALAPALAAKNMRILRAKRDELLAKTDWWVLPDRTPTQEQLDYRQALRDLPANTEDPENPVWPVKP
jgi:hypothetical protein